MINGVFASALLKVTPLTLQLSITTEEKQMIPTNRMRPIHPGEILREEFLGPLEMSANALALELKVAAPRVNDIVRERRAITPDTALRLACYFGTTAQFWLNLQSAYDLKVAELKVGNKIRREVHAKPAA
jgi:addiction module HigA family antidote